MSRDQRAGMTQGVERRLDGKTLVVRIPMCFHRRGERKSLRMLDHGVYASVSEIGDAENISKSYVSRILRIALVAPDIVEAILAGSTDQGMMLEQLERPLPESWDEQHYLLRT